MAEAYPNSLAEYVEANKSTLKATPATPLIIPERAVVVPGSRAVAAGGIARRQHHPIGIELERQNLRHGQKTVSGVAGHAGGRQRERGTTDIKTVLATLVPR